MSNAVTTIVAPLSLNGAPATSIRFLFVWKGVWLADVELAQDGSDPLTPFTPSGPAVLIVGAGTQSPQTLVGTVDPRNSGTFSNRTYARVVGGQGGWDQTVIGKHFNIPTGQLTSTIVYAATAALVKEPPPLDPTPVLFGTDYPRIAGPAREIFADRDWYVDPLTGVANVAPWPPAVPDLTLNILDFDPIEQVATLACQGLVLPGTVLTDTRFNGTSPIVRTVEQIFDQHGSRVTAWCSTNAVERFSEAFTLACRIAVDSAHLKIYQYRFVLPATGTDLALQAITPGAPDLNPIHQYNGFSGASNKFKPSTIIFVAFTADTPPQPVVVAVSPAAVPLQADIIASVEASIDAPTVNVGPTALQVAIGAKATAVQIGGSAAAPLTPATWATALAQALAAFALACEASTDPALPSAATTLAMALSALPASATTITEAA